jgi:ribosomal protein L30E
MSTMAQTDITEIQEALAKEALTIGTDVVIKKLKNKQISKVYITANAPDLVKEDIAHYANLAGVEVAQLEQSNEDLREICKKRYNISVLAK